MLACTALLSPGRQTAADAQDEWPSYNRTLDGQRFSQLREITVDTVQRLHEVCAVKVSDMGGFHSSPLVIRGRMYVATTRVTMALDAATCDVIWKSLYTPTAREVYGTVRGVAVTGDRLFRGTNDGHLLAFNAQTGELLWNIAPADSTAGEFLSAAPIVEGNKVFIGLSGSDWGIRGRMFAFDAATGRRLWTFNLIPEPGEAAAKTWAADSAMRGGGGTWTSYTLDVKSREIFIPVGNPAPTLNSGSRPGANLFTNSLVVLDADTGALKWWYQVSPADARDQDLAAPPLLFDLAGERPAVALGSKNGYIVVVDRRSHRLVFKTPVTTIYNEGQPVTEIPTRFCPGIVGGLSWNGPALDPQQHLLIAGATDWCALFQKSAPQYIRGELYWGGVTTPETQPAPSGWITALDSNSGAVRWRFHAPAPVVSGITPTAGGLTFAGDLGGMLYAFRTADGTKMFETALGGAIAGGISTYSVRGHQYVAVTSGNISRQLWGVSGIPSMRVFSVSAPALPSNAALTLHPDPSDMTDLPDSNHGKRIFASTCALCHGGGGEGATAPDLHKSPHARTAADVVDLIMNPPKAMPQLYPSTLTSQDVVDVAAYVSQF